MKLTIENKAKLEMFVALFQLLKNWGSYLSLQFNNEELYIQSMDKSHICLSSIVIKAAWFSEYSVSEGTNLSVDAASFATMMNYALKHNRLEITESGADKLCINLLNGEDLKTVKDNFDHFFELPLMDVEHETLLIPEVDYDVEFTMDAKKFGELISELMVFGPNLNIVCTEDLLELNANGEAGKLKVNVPIDSLNEFAISEGEKLDISYSLIHIGKMCLSSKLGNEISLGISAEYPMALKYSLGEGSTVAFFVAPKIVD
jgi:proliferating cell nuclear antigen PCNA